MSYSKGEAFRITFFIYGVENFMKRLYKQSMKKELKELVDNIIVEYLEYERNERHHETFFDCEPADSLLFSEDDFPEVTKENFKFNTFEDALNSDISEWSKLRKKIEQLYDFINSYNIFRCQTRDKEYERIKEFIQNGKSRIYRGYTTDYTYFSSNTGEYSTNIRNKLAEYLTKDMVSDVALDNGLLEERKKELIKRFYEAPYKELEKAYNECHNFFEEEGEEEVKEKVENTDNNWDYNNTNVNFDGTLPFKRVNRILKRMYKDARKMK